MQISPYKLAKDLGIKNPQLVYNYIRQGYLNATKNDLGHWVLDTEDPKNQKFIERRTK